MVCSQHDGIPNARLEYDLEIQKHDDNTNGKWKLKLQLDIPEAVKVPSLDRHWQRSSTRQHKRRPDS
jgi:hypothetical protein